MTLSALEAFRENNRFLRSVAATTLFFFCFSFYSPTVFAVKDGADKQASVERDKNLDPTLDPMSQQMQLLKQQVSQKRDSVADKLKEKDGLLGSIARFLGLEETVSIAILQDSVVELEKKHNQVIDEFDKTRQHIKNRSLSPAIMQRHEAAMEKLDQKLEQLKTNFALLESSQDLEEQNAALTKIDDQLSSYKLKRNFTPSDPNNLPWGAPDASKTRKPAKTPEELSRLTGILPFPKGTQLASNIITPDMLGQPGGPVAEDLAETIDAQLTDAIRTKAEELEFDPVKIYSWVRNTIEFIPSYGSIQGAEYTMQHGKGNAFDTASLLIALLRAANIPARYSYGTVEMPAEKVMNWVGGVDVPGAAQQLLGQGGIPNIAIVEGGEIRSIEIEHVWVEAWIDYLPSRGAKHSVGDHWIPMDASFKQYEFKEGLNIVEEVPFDSTSLIADIDANTIYDETQGYVQGLSTQTLSDAMLDYQQKVESYIANQNPEAVVADVLGSKKLIIWEDVQLSAGLPYKVVALTDAFSVLPSSLRHKFKYTLGSDLYGTEGERFITFEASLPETAGRKLMLTFRPKTQDDLDLVRSYIPAQSTSEEVDFAQIPDSLPGYLIQMTADFYQDQDVLYSADVGNFGENLFETIALWNPSFGWSQANNSPLVGESRAIGIDRQGINPVEVAAVQTELESIDAVLASEDAEEIAKLTKNQIIGGTFYSTIFNYFAVNSIQDQIQANSMGVVTYRLPSFGVFGTSLQTEYFYGTPRNVRMTGLVIDVDHLAVQSVAKDNDRSKVVQYTLLSGNRASAMEHEVPEAAFSSDDKPAQGISAVKALSIASNEGQKIWTIDIGNLSEALSAINLSSEVESDIRNAVNSGKIAIAHEAPVAFANGSNAGYLLLDTQTGAGAYMIAGGENGGFLDMLDGWLAKLEALIGDLEGWLGDAGPFLRPLQKAISQVKRLVRNIRGLIELVQTCNGVFTVVATLILAFAIRFIIAPIVAAAVGLGALICPATGFGAFVCLGLWATFVTAVVAEATNTFLEGMYDTFINSPLCRAQL